MSLTAEAIQNSNTIPKRDPTIYATQERSFCKLHLFTLQSATAHKSRLHYQARAAALLLCSITCSPPPAAHGCLMLQVPFPWALSVPPVQLRDEWGSSAPAGPAASLPAGLQHRAALPCQPPWNRAAGARARQTNTPESPECSYPILFSFPLRAGCWMFKRRRKIALVIQQQISDAQKQNTKTAA